MPDAGRPRIDDEKFRDLFGAEPQAAAHAFGRVNLVGEHTDYNGGFVLPTLIPQATTALIAPVAGERVRAWSRELSGDEGPRVFDLGAEAPGRGWVDYVQGVTVALRRAGFEAGGFDLALASDVPIGSGLSSSAALEVALLRALRQVFAFALDDVTLAKVGRAAETDFVGAPIGIMDQLVSSIASPGLAVFIDTRTLVTESLPLPPGVELLVVDSGVAHQHATGDYATRRGECERAATMLGVGELRDLGVEDLRRIATLPSPLDRRVRHVVTENQRVLDAVAAIRVGDARALGGLFTSSHLSQRDDYQCSAPEVDALVDIALGDPAVLGARLTGGGFGGSMVALVAAGDARRVAPFVVAQYRGRMRRDARVLVPAVP